MITPMNQQINLYQAMFRPRRVPLRARTMGALVALLVGGLGAVYAQSWWSLQPLERKVAVGQADVVAGEARLVSLAAQYPIRQPTPALARELARKRAALVQSREIAQKLRTGAYGSIAGLSPFLEAFARQHREGTWLTRVRVQAGGTALGLAGKTLLPELVPAYIERLGQEPILRGKAFSELELEAVHDGLDEITFSIRTRGLSAEDDS